MYKAIHELCQGDNSVMFRTHTTKDFKVFGLKVSSILSAAVSNNTWLACLACILNDAELKVLNVIITWIAQLCHCYCRVDYPLGRLSCPILREVRVLILTTLSYCRFLAAQRVYQTALLLLIVTV